MGFELTTSVVIGTECTGSCKSNYHQGEVYNIMRYATGRWFSLGPPVSSINKTDRNDITEILLKVALNTIKQTKNRISTFQSFTLTCFFFYFFSILL